jgi:hypothetical protein
MRTINCNRKRTKEKERKRKIKRQEEVGALYGYEIKREEHSPLAIHTAAFVHVLVLLAASLAPCYEESINLT